MKIAEGKRGYVEYNRCKAVAAMKMPVDIGENIARNLSSAPA